MESELLLVLIHNDDLLAVVVAAAPANPVSKLLGMALGALYQSGCADLPVSTTLITPCLRCFPFRDCHSLFLLLVVQQVRKPFQNGKRIAVVQSGAGALCIVQIGSANGTEPLAVGLAKTIGRSV